MRVASAGNVCALLKDPDPAYSVPTGWQMESMIREMTAKDPKELTWPTHSGITGGNNGSQGQTPLVRRSRDRGIDRDCLCGWLVWWAADTSATAVTTLVTPR